MITIPFKHVLLWPTSSCYTHSLSALLMVVRQYVQICSHSGCEAPENQVPELKLLQTLVLCLARALYFLPWLRNLLLRHADELATVECVEVAACHTKALRDLRLSFTSSHVFLPCLSWLSHTPWYMHNHTPSHTGRCHPCIPEDAMSSSLWWHYPLISLL